MCIEPPKQCDNYQTVTASFTSRLPGTFHMSQSQLMMIAILRCFEVLGETKWSLQRKDLHQSLPLVYIGDTQGTSMAIINIQNCVLCLYLDTNFQVL